MSNGPQTVWSSPGSVDEISLADGRVLRTTSVSNGPDRLALDARDGIIYFTNEGSTVRSPDPLSWLPSWLRRHLPLKSSSRLISLPPSISIIDEVR